MISSREELGAKVRRLQEAVAEIHGITQLGGVTIRTDAIRWTRIVVVVLVMMLTAITACDSTVDDPQVLETSAVPRWPATDIYEVPDRIRDATMVWSAEPGLDLFSTEGTLTRAALESVSIGLMVGLDYTYIGFAASSNSPGGGRLYGGFDDDTGQGPFVGTIYGRIQKILPTDSGFDVLSCVLSVGLDVREDGKYLPSRLADGDGTEMRSRFIRTNEPAMAPTSRPTSSAPALDDFHWQAPTGNEFLGWEIEGLTDRDPSTSGNGRCVPWARSLYPDAPAVIPRDAYARDTPPPVQPAYPGWPDAGS
ncbi:hypothetical protein C5142_23050 [Rhodococcus sp. BGS-1C]|uniref:hypothetical protein n=1 Tax=unclassified Rhodococcus (in: high G+C Gram-positive bacteria) TaxID=192944 RepID=UPI0019D1B437|nr:hypothetical protein [Rhodococcus sp. KRD197]